MAPPSMPLLRYPVLGGTTSKMRGASALFSSRTTCTQHILSTTAHHLRPQRDATLAKSTVRMVCDPECPSRCTHGA